MLFSLIVSCSRAQVFLSGPTAALNVRTPPEFQTGHLKNNAGEAALQLSPWGEKQNMI